MKLKSRLGTLRFACFFAVNLAVSLHAASVIQFAAPTFTVAENAGNLADWVYASCAMPFVFPPLTSKSAQGIEEQWVDGGVRDVTPLDVAFLERPRAILVVRASAAPKPARPKKYKSLVDIGLRAVDILSNEVSENDLEDERAKQPTMNNESLQGS